MGSLLVELTKERSFPVPESLRSTRLLAVVQTVYFVAIFGWAIWTRHFPDSFTVAMAVVLLCLASVRTRGFLAEFIPFILLLFSYEGLRGFIVRNPISRVHITELIRMERALFGGVLPTTYLQHLAADWGCTKPLFWLSWGIYLSHFVTPVVVALLLWHLRRGAQRIFLLGLLVMSYTAFLGYMLYPAAPPWLAGRLGYLDGRMIDPGMVPAFVMLAGPNAVAAMPSLHAAYPLYTAIFLVLVFGRRAAWTFALPLLVSFATVFLGHHYVVDLLAGYILAIAVSVPTGIWLKRSGVLSTTRVEAPEDSGDTAVDERELPSPSRPACRRVGPEAK